MIEEQVIEGQPKGEVNVKWWRGRARGRRHLVELRRPSFSFRPPRLHPWERGIAAKPRQGWPRRGGRQDGGAGAKAEGADMGWRLALHKRVAGAALSSARAAATGEEHGAMQVQCQQSPVLAGSATLVALGALVLYVAKPSGYGKHTESLKPAATRLPARAAWFLQELPSFAVPAGILARQPLSLFGPPGTVLLGLFCVHYFHR